MLARHPPNKRHTKPCKFFQTSRCPLSAQECDFAHVFFEEVVPHRQNNICRYHAAGNCGSGPKCKYRHSAEHTEERKAMTETMAIDPSSSYSRSPSSAIPPFHTPYHTVYPAPPSAWVPYGDTYLPPVVYPPDTVPVTPFFKPSLISTSYSPGDSSNSASTSARSSLSGDVEFVTEDPKYGEHSYEHQSQIRIAEKRPVVHVSPFYSSKNGHDSVSPVSPVIVKGPPAAARSNVHPSSSHICSPIFPPSAPRVRSRSNSRYKTSNYKTKACKYFSVDGHCPNGNECTFIHEEPVPKIISSTTQNVKPPPGLPPKPISQLEENHKRNYFPVSWRVIGGGVLIGDPTHTSVSQDGPPEWTENTNRECMDKQLNAYPGPIDANSAIPPSAAGCHSPKPARRPRSTSIPSSSRPAQVKMMKSLFPAESPGSL